MGYPNDIKSFTFKVNNVDKVVADDVNVIYTEVTEIEKHLGVGGAAYGTGSWGSGGFSTSITNWYDNGGLKARLQNIEAGVLPAYNAISTIVSNLGGSTINISGTAVVGLKIKSAAGTVTGNLLNITDNSDNSLVRVEPSGRLVAYVIDGGTA
jgi:hypothetical protein